MTEKAGYTWVPFFKELGEKLLTFQDRQADLVALLKECGVTGGLEDKKDGETERLSEIDPFTFFSLSLKKGKDENRTAIFRCLKAKLQLDAPLPSDYLGVPTPNALNAWFFAYAERRSPEDVPTLWRMARAAISGSVDEGLWKDTCAIHVVGVAKVTQGLFWIQPEKYLPIDVQTRPFLKDAGIDPSFDGWNGYLALLDRVRRHLPMPFYQISHEAWRANQDPSMDHIDIHLTAGAIRNGYLAIPRNCGIFSSEHYGGKDPSQEGRKFRLSLPGGDEVETDIRRDESGASRIRARFYSLFKRPEFRPGAIVRLARMGNDHYELSLPEQPREDSGIQIDRKILAQAVEKRIRPILIGERALAEGGEEGYQHHKILPKAQPLLTKESISSDPIGSVKGALAASGNLLSQFEAIKANRFLEKCSEEDAETNTLDLLYGSDELESRIQRFLDWSSVAHHKTEKGSIGFNPTVVSYLLCMSAPTRYAFCKPENYWLAAKALLGPEAVESDRVKRIRHATEFYKEALRLFREEHDLPFEDLLHVHIAFWVMREAREGFPTWDDLMNEDSGKKETHKETSQPSCENLILYGPPGTGKTYHLVKTYLPRYVADTDEMSEDQWLESMVGDRPWLEVIAAALKDLGGGPARVSELLEHPFIQARSRARGVEKLSANTIWSYLQHHTAPDCPNVKLNARREPAWFWKDADSRWSFAEGWETEGDQIVDLVETLNAGPENSGEAVRRYEFVTFHQSYSYEEFVEGIRPLLDANEDSGSQISYVLSKGVFRRICEKARRDPGNQYALFIDEINRGNIAKILGELITLIEPDKREGAANAVTVRLPYSKENFSVPGNLDVIGTMNTADRSLTHIDTALRRRFRFEELMPDPSVLTTVDFDGVVIDLPRLLTVMNRRIEAIFDREHTIGHAYFLRATGESVLGAALPGIFRDRIIPLLTEYFFDDWSRVRMVLADDAVDGSPDLQFIHAREVEDGTFASGTPVRLKPLYRLNREAFSNPRAYVKIYAGPSEPED